jgi:hypothetical protein
MINDVVSITINTIAKALLWDQIYSPIFQELCCDYSPDGDHLGLKRSLRITSLPLARPGRSCLVSRAVREVYRLKLR